MVVVGPDRTLAEVGVVVVTYGSADVVGSCLASLPLAELGDVVVVDNNSPDETLRVLQDFADRVQIVALPHNLGFGGGCNAGAQRLSSARYLLFLNPDASIDASGLRELLRYLEAHPSVALIAPRLFRGTEPLTSAGAQSTAASELHFVLPARLKRLVGDRRLPAEYARTGAVGYVEGACMLVDAAAFRAVGGFDERYFLFFEELDLSRRLAARGLGVHLVASASAQHAVGRSRAAAPMAGRLHYWTSCVRYLRKWHGNVGAATFCAVAVLSWIYETLAGALRPRDLVASLSALKIGWREGVQGPST